MLETHSLYTVCARWCRCTFRSQWENWSWLALVSDTVVLPCVCGYFGRQDRLCTVMVTVERLCVVGMISLVLLSNGHERRWMWCWWRLIIRFLVWVNGSSNGGTGISAGEDRTRNPWTVNECYSPKRKSSSIDPCSKLTICYLRKMASCTFNCI